jgi:hypothetical protein
MTTATTARTIILCRNLDCRRFGKPIGEVEASSEAFSVTVTMRCGTCRLDQRQTLRVG